MMAVLLLSHPFITVTVLHVTSNLRFCRIMTISLSLDWRSWSKLQAEKNFCTHFVLSFSGTGKRLVQRYQMTTLPQLFLWDLGYKYLLQTLGRFGADESNPLLLEWCKDVRGRYLGSSSLLQNWAWGKGRAVMWDSWLNWVGLLEWSLKIAQLPNSKDLAWKR